MRVVKTILQIILSMLALILGSLMAIFTRPGAETTQEIIRYILLLLGGTFLASAGAARLYQLYWPFQMEIWREKGFPSSFVVETRMGYANCTLCFLIGFRALCTADNYLVAFVGLIAVLTAAVARRRFDLTKKEIEQRDQKQ